MKSANRNATWSFFSTSRQQSRASRRRMSRFELLEERRVLSTLGVTTAVDELDFTNDDLSLREAIVQANSEPGPNTIEFDPSLAGIPIEVRLGEDVFGEFELDPLVVTESLTINGLGAEDTVIDAYGLGSPFSIGGENVQLNNLTIRGGRGVYEDQGGAINSGAESLEMTGCVIEDNSAWWKGGGVYVHSGTLTLTDSIVRNNLAEQYGGGDLHVGRRPAGCDGKHDHRQWRRRAVAARRRYDHRHGDQCEHRRWN